MLPCIIKSGLKGEITVNGRIFKEKMPASPRLANIEIAEIITYVSNSFGNNLGLYHVEKVDTGINNCQSDY
jgi:hypothetical protein